MNLLYPKIDLKHLPGILGHAAVGALVAAVYGIVHDQITYSISPEYFTRLKFMQFHYADFGLPRRIFVAEVRTEQEADQQIARYGKELLPITAEEHLNALSQAGFGIVELFWYSQTQAGFYALK